MSISSALNNASSGLAAQSRLAETISNNVANALTPGYARRTTELSSVALGGYGQGVTVVGTTRAGNATLTAERRAMDAALGASGTRSDAYDRILTAIGDTSSDTSVASMATKLETALMTATSSPQSTTALNNAVSVAKDLASAVNRVSDETASLRTEADAEIGRQVTQVNAALNKIDTLNDKIKTLAATGGDTTSLEDQRAQLIDSVSAVVPVKVANRDGGAVALFTQNGGALLDGRVYELSFTPASTAVTADMTVGSGLSGLSQDVGALTGPVAVTAGTGAGLFDGGTLGALFELRDTIAPQVQGEMDGYAADIIDRFQSLMPSSALDASGNGLFVDPASGTQTGLAGRLAVNAAVDPSSGGAVWRLRDGLAATSEGNVGDGTTLQALSDAFTTSRAATGFASTTSSGGAAALASEITSFFASRGARSDEDRAYLSARQATLAEQESSATGVDSDSELQSLTLVEQAYAANAKVLSVIDDLMQLLLEN
ncbi:MAG: flagellar hook-associated protein FlgK [Amaricoccus sp.]|uniref:flagellar hook-associated protein FlgK n=1 Tax=Amaricoccus sp. TaxID=1872485 RepID=UPI0039E55338